MIRKLALVLSVFIGQSVSADTPGFVGNLVLIPPGCEASGKCSLGEDFGYVDPNGVGWQAKKDDNTDGASIPSWAQPLVGKPFEPSYIKAAVIHDHYCDRHVRPWRDTHRVFFDALVSSGVDSQLAGILYGAVYLGGPRWRETIPGVGCPIGKICTSTVKKSVPEGTQVQETDEGHLVIVRPDRYGTPEFNAQFEAIQTFILAHPADLTAESIADEADKLFPEDLFFTELPYGPSDAQNLK